MKDRAYYKITCHSVSQILDMPYYIYVNDDKHFKELIESIKEDYILYIHRSSVVPRFYDFKYDVEQLSEDAFYELAKDEPFNFWAGCDNDEVDYLRGWDKYQEEND